MTTMNLPRIIPVPLPLTKSQRRELREIPLSNPPEGNTFPFPKSMVWQAIRDHCLECVGSAEAVRTCGGEEIVLENNKPGMCHLYPYRFGSASVKHAEEFGFTKSDYSQKRLYEVIRSECRYCLNGNALNQCSSPKCALFQVRHRKSAVNYNKPLSDKEKARLDELNRRNKANANRGQI